MPTLFYKIKRKLYKLFHPAWGEIIMLHRVVEKRSQLEANRQMEITPEFLEKTILDYHERGYRFVSLDEVHEIVSTQKRLKQKFVCFTFDDGYVDNYELAYPILKKYNCPFAIYVATDFPDGKALLWWYVLEDILLKNKQIKLGDGSEYLCDSFDLKNQVFNTIRNKIFLLQGGNMSVTLTKLFSPYQFSFSDILKTNSLTWEQVKELANDPICTIGSHSVTHAAFDQLSDEKIMFELLESKKIIEGLILKSVNHFAYPYGRINFVVEKNIKSLGYKTASLANGGFIRDDFNVYKLFRRELF